MDGVEQLVRIPFDTMRDVITEAFVRAGMSAVDAAQCAELHTQASCDGVYSHGLNRVARFVDYVQKGWVDLDGKPELVRSLAAIEVFDGHRGPGILNALFASERSMELAKKNGVGIVALRNTTHWMRGGAFGWHAADKGYVAMCWTNTESCMPAWGAQNTRLGNNPFVMAVPRDKGHIVLDMAMSQYAYGKLQVTRLKGEQLPFPGGFDKNGVLTSEPGPIEESMRILPMGYWKGSGFAILLDTLAAVLSEGAPTYEIDQIQEGSCTGCSQIFIAIDPRQLGGEDFTNRVTDGIADYVNSSTTDEKSSEVIYPGQLEVRVRKDHLENGIIVDDGVWGEVLALAGRSA